MLTELSTASRVVGAKQVRRALTAGKARTVFLARDADPNLTGPIAVLCEEMGVAAFTDCSMKELGRACGIAVPAAVAAIVNG